MRRCGWRSPGRSTRATPASSPSTATARTTSAPCRPSWPRSTPAPITCRAAASCPAGGQCAPRWGRYLGIRLLHAPLISLAAGHRYTDTTNGFRAYSARFLSDPRVAPFRDVFSAYELHYYPAIRAARLGFRIVELPVTRAYPAHAPDTDEDSRSAQQPVRAADARRGLSRPNQFTASRIRHRGTTVKPRALIGVTGFVGGNLQQQMAFDAGFHSRNIDTMAGGDYSLVVCAGAPAEKWRANQAPEADQASLARLTAALEQVQADRVVLVSTVDVYPSPVAVDEAAPIDPRQRPALRPPSPRTRALRATTLPDEKRCCACPASTGRGSRRTSSSTCCTAGQSTAWRPTARIGPPTGPARARRGDGARAEPRPRGSGHRAVTVARHRRPGLRPRPAGQAGSADRAL